MPIPTYETFELRIQPGQNKAYEALVTRSLAGDARGDFTLPFGEDELAAFLWQTVGVSRHFGAAGEAVSPSPNVQEFGAQLYQAVFKGDVAACLRRSLDEAKRRGSGLRIRLRIDDRLPALADLPWEVLYAPELGRFLALSDDTPLLRYLEVPHAAPLQPVRPPLVVLAVLSNPAGVTPLAVDSEWAHLQEAVSGLGERQVRLERVAATWPALQARLRQGPAHVLHFIGHGYFDDVANQGGLVFEDDKGQAVLTPAEKFKVLLHDQSGLRLVFLNACEGAASGRSDSFAGVAQQLVQQAVPAVVAMQFPVTDQAAITLSREFYRALADGYPVDAAIGEARKAVFGLGDSMEWGTPVLFSRSDDNRLIELPQGDRRDTIERQPFEPETILIPGGPFLMGTDDPAAPAWERPSCTVNLPDYRIGACPVTNQEFAEFVRQERRLAAPEWGWTGQKPQENQLNQPVTGVTWYDALAYCQWLSKQYKPRVYTLPSEAQWEKAAAGTYGCQGMVDSVRQWTRSLWGEKRKEPDSRYEHPGDDAGRNDLTAPSVVRRIYRGGAAADDMQNQRCAARQGAAPDSPGLPGKRFGLRVVMELDSQPMR